MYQLKFITSVNVSAFVHEPSKQVLTVIMALPLFWAQVEQSIIVHPGANVEVLEQ